MEKGQEQNQVRQQALVLPGRDLARRARLRYELTHASGGPLVTDVCPEPEFESWAEAAPLA